ncbi:mucin-19-like [Penaeus chinensis]|uniref:mucin-19-like n=1 Tax=Penaeus chinensis TaxID=139456 RepID=UPI001FB6E0B2|nr:mucin-19-like [Penaeus chinensis]
MASLAAMALAIPVLLTGEHLALRGAGRSASHTLGEEISMDLTQEALSGGLSGRPFSLSTGGFNPAVVSQPTRVIVQTVPVVVDIVNRTHGSLIPHSQQSTAFAAPPLEARTNFGEGFFSPGFRGFQQQVNNVDPFAFPPFFDSQLEGAAGQGNPENSSPGAGADTSQGSSSNSMADLIGMPVSVVATVNRKGAALVDGISEQNAVLSIGPQDQADQSPQEPQLPAENAAAALVPSAEVLGEASVDTSDTLSASTATASLDQPTESISLGQSVSVALAAQESSVNPISGDVPQDQPDTLASASGSGKALDAAEGSDLNTMNESAIEENLPIPAALSTFAALGTPPIFRGETNKNLQQLMKTLTSKGAATGSPSADSGTITPQVHPDNSHLAASSGNIGQVSGQVLTEQTFPAVTELTVIPMGMMATSGHAGGAGVDNIASAVPSPSIIQAEVRSLSINNPTSSLSVSVPEKMSVTQMLAQQVKQAMSGLDTSLQVLPFASGGLSGPAVGEASVADPSAPIVISRIGVIDAQDTLLSSVGEQMQTSTNAGESLSHNAGLTHLNVAPGGSTDASVQGLLGNGDTAAIGVLGSAAVDLAMAHGEPSVTVQVQGASTSTDAQAPHSPTSATVSQTTSDVTSQVASNLEALARPGLAIAHGQPVLTGVSVNTIGNQGIAQGQDFPVTGTSAGLSLGNQGSSEKTSGLELSASTADTVTGANQSPVPVSKIAQDMKRLHGLPALDITGVVSSAATSNVTASGLSNLVVSLGSASKQIGEETGPVATSRIGLAPVVASFATGEAINTSPATATLAAPLVLNNGPHSFPKDMHINKGAVIPNPTTPTPVTTTQKAPSSPSSAIKVTNFSTCGTLSTTAATSTNKPLADVTEAAVGTQTTHTKSASASSQLFPDQSTSRPILPAVSPSLQAGSEQQAAKIAIGKSVLSSAVGSSASLGSSGAKGLEEPKTTGTPVTTGSIGNTATSTSTGSTVNIETSVAEGSLGNLGQVDTKEPNLPVQNTLQTQTVVTDIKTQGNTVQQQTQQDVHTTASEIGRQASGIPGIVLALPLNSLFSPSAFQGVSGNPGSATGTFLENFSITSDPNQFVQLLRNFHSAQSPSDGRGNSVDASFVKSLPASVLATSHGQTVLKANTQTTSSLATAAPVTPVSFSSAPVTPDPVSSAPVTPVSFSSAPVTPVPVLSAPVTQIPNTSSAPQPPLPSVSTSRPRVVSVISPSGSITFMSEEQARLTTSLGFGVPLQAAAGNASTVTGLKSIQEPPLTTQGNTLKRELPSTSVAPATLSHKELLPRSKSCLESVQQNKIWQKHSISVALQMALVVRKHVDNSPQSHKLTGNASNNISFPITCIHFCKVQFNKNKNNHCITSSLSDIQCSASEFIWYHWNQNKHVTGYDSRL